MIDKSKPIEGQLRAAAMIGKVSADNSNYSCGVTIGQAEEAADTIESLRTQLAAMIEWVERAEACLPKDRNGNCIYHGSEVWISGDYQYPGYAEAILEGGFVGVNDSIEWGCDDCRTLGEWTVRNSANLFTTREAALAAQQNNICVSTGKTAPQDMQADSPGSAYTIGDTND